MGQGGRNFIVYKSSAGSGKTFTLVKEYLQIILRNPDSFRNVLAITFTNKAANEMKERIIRYLKSLADPVTHNDTTVKRYLQPDIIAATGLTEEELQARAAIALKLMMHHYSDFAVSTIDSFFHRVVRTFAFDLNIPMTFEVVLDEKDTLVEVVSLLLDRVGTDEELTRILVRFVQNKTEDEKSWDIEKDLVKFSEVLVKESSIPYLEQVAALSVEQIEQAGKIMRGYVRSFETQLAGTAGALLETFRARGIEGPTLAGGSRGMMGWLKKLVRGDLKDLKVPVTVSRAMEKGEWSAGKATPEEKALIASIRPEIDAAVRALQHQIGNDKRTYLSFKIMQGFIYPIAVLGALNKELENFRTENNILLISEFNRRIHDVVREQPAPFIFERLGEKYRHFMIDEFQDTSVLQWHNVMPLMENSLAEGNLNLVVGDGKQAIYRFRSGDVRQFEKLPELLVPAVDRMMKDREQTLVRNFSLRVLKKNFRSAQTVVSFNNRLFSRISEWKTDEMLPVYADVNQQVAGKSKGGVQLEFVTKEENGPGLKELMVERVLCLVDELISGGFCQQDIAVLCRANKDASSIAGTLLSAGKQVISADSLILSFSPEVNFLMAWIRCLVNPADDVSRAHILMYLRGKGKLTGEDVEHFLLDGSIPAKWEEPSVRDEYLQEGFTRMIHENFPDFAMDDLLHMDLYHVIGDLERNFIDLSCPDPYLQFFQDQVLDLLKRDRQSLTDVLEWWEEKGNSLSISTPEGLDAIRVMTIHKAKGLEFPVVIYAFASDTLKPTLKSIWVEVENDLLKDHLPVAYINFTRELGESDFSEAHREENDRSFVDLVNVCYVAMTRARDHLFVLASAPPKDTGKVDSIPKMLKRFLQEEGLWQEDRQVFSFGEPGVREEKGQEEDRVLGSPSMPPGGGFADWKNRVLLRRSVPEYWEVEDPEKGFAFGNKVHFVLSEMKYAEDARDALKTSMMNGVLDPGDREAILPVIHGLVTGTDTSWLFDPAWLVRNESEIINEEGMVFRPDRLMFREDEVIVVDYKTGKQSERHRKQLKTYAALLEEMGWRVTGAYIVYLSRTPEVINALTLN